MAPGSGNPIDLRICAIRRGRRWVNLVTLRFVGKLIARSEGIRSQLPDSEVIAVLTTARPRAGLSGLRWRRPSVTMLCFSLERTYLIFGLRHRPE